MDSQGTQGRPQGFLPPGSHTHSTEFPTPWPGPSFPGVFRQPTPSSRHTTPRPPQPAPAILLRVRRLPSFGRLRRLSAREMLSLLLCWGSGEAPEAEPALVRVARVHAPAPAHMAPDHGRRSVRQVHLLPTSMHSPEGSHSTHLRAGSPARGFALHLFNLCLRQDELTSTSLARCVEQTDTTLCSKYHLTLYDHCLPAKVQLTTSGFPGALLCL